MIVSDVLPTNAALEWLIDEQASPECSIASGVLTCNVGTLAANTSRSFHIFSPTSSATCGTVENNASVSDSHGVIGKASASLTVNCPDLTVTSIAASEAVSSGDPIRFDMTVTNNGAGKAKSVTLSDTLPIFSGSQWSVGGTDGASCTIASGVLTCSFSDLTESETRTIYITSPTVYSACSTSPYTAAITNTATVAASNEPAGQLNNSAAASTNVQCPVFRILLWTENPSYMAGDSIDTFVDFFNGGEGIARDVLLEVSLPTNPGLSWSVTGSSPEGVADHCTFGPDEFGTFELMCTIDQITPDEEVIITITTPTTYGSCGLMQSSAYVSASNGGGDKFKGKDYSVTCPNVTATSTVDQAGFTRDYAWAVEKTVDANYANTVLEPVPFNYTVNVSQTGFTDSAWLVQGKITVTNPNPNLAISGATVTDAVDNGGICTVEAGTDVTIPAGGSVTLDYGCTYADQPEYSGNNTATVAWDQITYPFPPPDNDVKTFEFTALSTNNQSIDVTDSFNGETIQLNADSILASDNPEALTTWSHTYTREAPAPTNACADYTFTTEMPGTGESASQTVRVCLPSLVTDSALCDFDVDTATPAKDFKLLFTPDPSGPNSIYKLNASNPGQFYYNIFYANPASAPVSPVVTLTLPYPFVTQGAVPLHAYNNVRVSSQNGRACLLPGAEITNSKAPVFGMADWGSSATFGSTREIQIQLPEIPANGFAYLNLHLDYGLKDTSGYTRGLNDSAVSPAITIPNPQLYTFTDNLGMTHSINSINVFKKNPGIGGQAASGSTMNPVSNTRMDIYDSNKKLLATVYTDEDGWYMWSYKYTGKAATFYVKATAPGYSKTQAITLKSNAFVVADFLDLP